MNKEDIKYINSLRTRVENLSRKTNININKEASEYHNTKENLMFVVEQVEVFFKNNLVKQQVFVLITQKLLILLKINF